MQTPSIVSNLESLQQIINSTPGNDYEYKNVGELLYSLFYEGGQKEIGGIINYTLYGDKRIIDSAQLELFEDQSMLVKMAEKVGMSVEQLK